MECLEQREKRQTNTFDCGAFVCADIVALVESGVPSLRTQDDMEEWRREILTTLRTLKVYTRSRSDNTPGPSKPIIVLD